MHLSSHVRNDVGMMCYDDVLGQLGAPLGSLARCDARLTFNGKKLSRAATMHAAWAQQEGGSGNSAAKSWHKAVRRFSRQ